MKKLGIFIPLSVMVLASCGQAPAASSGGGGGVTSSDAPVVSSEGGGGGGGSSSAGGGGGGTSSADSGGGEGETSSFSGIVRIHFHEDLGTEANYRPYVWCAGVDGVEANWTGDWKDGTKTNGKYYDMDVSQAPYAGFVTGYISFIIKQPGTWAGQSADTVIKFSDYTPVTVDGKQVINVYSCRGEGNLIEAYADPTDALGDSFKTFYANANWTSFTVEGQGQGGGKVASYKLYCFDETYFKNKGRYGGKDLEDYQETFKIKDGTPNSASFQITGVDIDPQKTYRISGIFTSNPNKTKKKAANFDKLYDTSKFTSNYTYSGNDLGVKYSSTKTEFRIWAPTSTMVRLKIYKYGTPSEYTENPDAYALTYDNPLEEVFLTKQAGGVFSGTLEGDYDGRYYTYELFYNEGTVETIDPWATACGVNGLRGAIVDWAKTNPEGWDSLSFPAVAPNNLSVYEVHVRDFTADDSWISAKTGDDATPRGTYNAFCEEGTKYNGKTTGFDHLKELGINAVQLLPVFDQDNDERTLEKEVNGQKISIKPGYNWGYNPQNYNCVEGSYSTNPNDAATRIKEYKNLIYKLGKAGIRTIMDVVYNHVASVSKNAFTAVAPRYFFWYDEKSNLIDYSGCGNAVRSDREMSRKFIVDSCRFWCEQYKIKGFRFDLMGVIDTTTMRQIKDTLYTVDPGICVYGEGWTGEPSGGAPANASKTGAVYDKLGDNGKGVVGCFNDAGRDGAKGNTAYGSPYPGDGWVNTGSNVDNVYDNLTQILGQNRHEAKDGVTMEPNQTVNYLACHDNYTLYDQVNYLWHKDSPASWALGTDTNVMQMCNGLQAMSSFGQGIAFLHGGDEFYRQKVMKKADDPKLFEQMVETFKYGRYDKTAKKTEYSSTDWSGKDYDRYNYWTEGDGIKIDANTWLVRNSYKYGDAVNAFDWSRKATYEKWYNYMKDLYQLRKAEMGNALGQTKAQIASGGDGVDPETGKKNGGTTCWNYKDLFDETTGASKTDLLAGYFKGQTKGGHYYIFSNKGNVDPATIGIGNGSYEILYSSNGRHTVGQTMTVTNNLMGAYKYETLILKAA